MSEQADLSKDDLRTDAQKFQDAMRSILAAPKKDVMEQLAKEKEKRRKSREQKHP